MEENKKSEAGDTKTDSKQSNPFEAFMGNMGKEVNIPEWLMHLLTGAGAIGANYLLWIKPMQDKMETMNLQIIKQESRIRELEDAHNRLINELKRQSHNGSGKEDDSGYFNIKRDSSGSAKNGSHTRIINL